MAAPKPKPGDPIADLVESLLVELGEDPDRPGLKTTPDRVSRALRELTDGYGVKPEDVIADAFDRGQATCRMQRLEVRLLKSDRPPGRRKRLRPKLLLLVLSQEISDFRERFRSGHGIHHVNCLGKRGSAQTEAR